MVRSSLSRGVSELKILLGAPRGAILVVGEPNRIAQAMVHPIREWLPRLADGEIYELSRSRAVRVRPWRRLELSVVFLQCWFNTPRSEVEALILDIRRFQPGCKIVFLDWYAPTHIPQAWIADDVDLYIKKHLLRDRNRYIEGFSDTNLVEYEARWVPSLLPDKQPGIDHSVLDEKVLVGWNSGTDRLLSGKLAGARNRLGKEKLINVHCRIATQGMPWYEHMRGRALEAISSLRLESSVCSSSLTSAKKYWRELESAKVCVSPFGYGEVCWRDFEAIVSGAALVKPDMSHMTTAPDIFVPFETYVPVKWDWSDLSEKLKWLFEDEQRRLELVQSAIVRWERFIDSGWSEIVQNLQLRLLS